MSADALRDTLADSMDKAASGWHAPLPIEAGQTISQPYIVALMIELAGLRPTSRVLEVGAGSGYAAAVMGRIAREVYAVERQGVLARLAAARMAALGYRNVTVLHRDGSDGLPEQAPFDAIIVSAGGTEVPPALKDQLAIGGRLVIPIGAGGRQRLVRIIRTGAAGFADEDHGPVRFVPLLRGVEGGEPGPPGAPG
jgi:protein-L-isoaspartate(D-aspartate) O-methyltransferase